MLKKLKRLTCIILLFAVTMSLAACDDNSISDNKSKSDDMEISDLQMALLCDIVYRDELDTFLENGQELPTDDDHSPIRHDYLEDMSDRNLPAELSGFTVADFDHGDITGFRAAAFKKSNSIVVVYCGTEDFADIISDIGVAMFDFSSQDGQAKQFAEDNAKQNKDCNIYVAGYSMGCRLAYLGAETIVDTGHGDRLRRVCTFNGLGVKEALDFSDSNLSNIHSLEAKMKDITVNHIVKGDDISDDWIKNNYGLLHIGKLLYYDCTNPHDKEPIKILGFEVDMTKHDLYTFIDALSGHLKESEQAADAGVYTDAYRAYLDLLIKNKEQIEEYTWQKEMPRPVVIADVYGDDTPELIYMICKTEVTGPCAYINIVTYQNGAIKELFHRVFDSQVGGSTNYCLFQCDSGKSLYAYSCFGCDYWKDTYFRFAEENGILNERENLEYMNLPDYDNIVNGEASRIKSYAFESAEISESQYIARQRELHEHLKSVLMCSAYVPESIETFINENGCAAMTCSEAILFLQNMLPGGKNRHRK